jgi:hypothetical protein
MKALFSFFLLSLSSISYGQFFFGNIDLVSPANPSIGDTVLVRTWSQFQYSGPNGPTCGTLINYTDTLIQNEIQLDLHYSVVPVTNQVTFCTRRDSLYFIASNSGSYDIIANWNMSGFYLGNPFNVPDYISDTFNISISPIVGLNELSKHDMISIVNPIAETLNFFGVNKDSYKQIRIYDLNGRLKLNILTNQSQINIGNFNDGIYLLVVDVNGTVKRQKILIDN